MEISRREFLRLAAASAAALGVSSLQLDRVERVFAGASSAPVLWLHGATCTGCSVSLLNAVNPTIDQVLLNTISLKYHPTLSAAAGEMAVQTVRSTQAAGNYVLVIEGAIPTANGGKACYVWDENGHSVTMSEAVSSLAANASHIVAVGTCASFGGIPKAYCATDAKGVKEFLPNKAVINVPGCPVHPDWIIGTLVKVLSGTLPALDSNFRPTQFYTSSTIHSRCPRREADEASQFGQDGRCLEELGCKGPRSHADCDTRKWNNGQNWCIGVNGLCVGCVEPTFPAFPLHKSGASGVAACTVMQPPAVNLDKRVFLPLLGN